MTDGVARNPAAPTRATKATTATSQAGWMRRRVVTYRFCEVRDDPASGRKAIMRKNWAMPHVIAVVALDGVVPFDLGTATQVFGAARDAGRNRLYDVRVCGIGPVRTSAGFTIVPDHDLSALEVADTVVVP